MNGLVEPIKNKKDIEAVERFLSLYSKRNRLIFAFGINTGLRISDMLGLNIKDVQDKTYVEMREKKTGKYKKIPLNNKLQRLIRDYLATERRKSFAIEDTEPLFVGKKHCRLDRSQVYRFLNKACNMAGLTVNIGTHTMRKTFGYHNYKQFNNIALLQKILNHSSPATTLRYIGIDQDEIDFSYNNFVL